MLDLKVNGKYQKGKSNQILMICTVEDMKRDELREDDASSQDKRRDVMKHELLTIDWINANKANIRFIVSYCQILWKHRR